MTTPENKDHLLAGFEHLIHSVKEGLHNQSPLANAVANGLEKLAEAKELTREEIDKLHSFLQRDIQDAAVYLEETGEELTQWLKFDIAQLENHFASLLALMVDETRQKLTELELEAKHAQDIHTGEIVAAGTLACNSCDNEITFHKPGRVPPCGKCRTTHFRRISVVLNEADGE